MMKSLLVASLFCLTGTIAHAQNALPPGFVTTTKPILCGPLDVVFKTMASKEINERPIWVGQDENRSNYVIFVNAETSGFTLVQFGEQIACILGLGPTSNSYPVKPQMGKPM